MSSLIVRQSALARAGLFDESFRYPGSEDLDFVSRLAMNGPLQCVPRVLGSYRVHPASAMARERVRINFEARFVRQRIARRAQGGDLTWEEFRASYRRTWAERRRDLVEVWYRSAALWHGEGRRLRAFGYGCLAVVASPWYTIRRLYRQQVRKRLD
jgi:GT2 family glycosyltransferase